MTSARQLAANRQNARKSTGPRSAAGKHRASFNSFRHGLSSGGPIMERGHRERVELLARHLADGLGPTVLEEAWTAAAAHCELMYIRRMQLALIERIKTFGTLDVPFAPTRPAKDVWHMLEMRIATGLFPPPPDHEATLPTTDPERTTEALRRALPELLKLTRFERRAAARRDRALNALLTERPIEKMSKTKPIL
jgi:hypothetical protein